MRKTQRWNNETSKRSPFDSMLDRVVRDLFSGPDRSKYRHSGAVRPATKPRRQSFALEAIEPRLLMSDTPFSASQAAALTAGLQGLSTWADTLDNSGALAQSLPTYTQTGADPDLPKTYDTLGGKVDLGTQIDNMLVTPLKNYFATDSDPTLTELVTKLNAVSGVTVTGSVIGGEIALTAQLDASVAATTGKIDVVSAANGIQAQTSLGVSEHLTFDFTFGLDLTAGLSAPEAFFIRVPDDGLVLSADGHKANIAGSDGRVGFLGVTFGDGTANSKIDFGADVNVRFTNSEVNADGKITLSELQGTELSSLVTQNATGSLGVSLPTSATLGSFTFGNALLTLTDTNLFDAAAPAATLGGAGAVDMLKFNNINSSQMLTLADELGVFLNSLQARDVLKFDVPFVKGENLSSLDDFGSQFAAKLTSELASNGLRELVHPANSDGTGEVLPNTPSFASAQDLGKKLATALGLADANAGVTFNPATGELTYHIKLSTSATEGLTLDVPDTGALHGVTTSNPAALTETGTLEYTFGINLSPVAAGGNDSLERHFFVKDAALEANIAMSAQALIGASGQFGLVDFTASSSGSGTAKLTKNLQDPTTSAPQITLENLLTGVVSAPAALTTAGVLSGASHVDLTSILVVPAETGFVGPLGSNPAITLSKTAPNAQTVLTTSAGAAPLLKFANLDAADIVAALHEADDYLGKIATLGRLGKPIPGLGVSAADLVHLADTLDAAIAKFQAHPPQSLSEVESKLSEALTAAGKTAVTVTFAADPVDSNALKLSLQFGSSTSSKMPLRLDLQALASIAEQGAHAADDQLALVDLTAASNQIDVDAAASFKLDLGISLADPAQPAPFIYDTSSLTLNIHVAEAGLALALAAGPLQVAVAGGNVLIDKDGLGASNDPASFAVDVKDPGGTPNGRITSDELALVDTDADVGVAVTGQIHATLPTTFGNPSQGGNLALDINNLGDELAGAPQSVNLLGIPDFSSQLSPAALANNLGVVGDGLDSLLKTLQSALNSEVFGKNLPLVGDNLASLGTGAIDKFRNDFITPFKTALGSNPDDTAVRDALFTVLTSPQLHALGDTDGNNVINIEDIQLPGTHEFRFLLVEPIFTASTNLGFDLGLPALGLKSDAKVKADLSFNWLVDFGVSATDGFFLNTGASNELSLTLGLTIPNATASGDLGFLHLAIDDQGSNLTGTVAVDLKDANSRLTLAELASGPNFGALLAPTMDIKSKVDLNLNVSFGGSALFPSFNTEFLMVWDFNAASPEAAGAGPSVLQFKDVSLELGSFVSDFLKPIVDNIKHTLDPIKPVLDFLTEPIPVLSDIPGLPLLLGDTLITPDPADGIELVEIASRVLGIFGVPPQIFDVIAVIDKVNDIANLLSAPNPANQLAIKLGTFDLAGALASQGGDARQAGGLDDLQIDVDFDPLTSVKKFVDDNLPDNDILRQATDKLFTSAQRSLGSIGLGSVPNANDLRFPVLDNPETLFGLLLGRDVNLFELELAPFTFSTGLINQSVPLFGPLSAGLFGDLTISGDFAFAYDTRGLVEVADKLLNGGGLHPELLVDGFYISDTGTVDGAGPDIPELTFQGAIGAKAEWSGAVVAVGVKGGVFANLVVNLNDPNDDGKLRGLEIADVIGDDPLCLFDTSGDVHAGLYAYVKVGFPTPFGFVTLFEDSLDIASKVILNLDHECDVEPVLATLTGNGLLTLNMGPNAGARLFGGDDAEVFAVTQVGDGVVDVTAFGLTQRYGDKGVKVTSIFADGGAHDDVITLDPSVTIGSTLRGGADNDQITGGSAVDNISGDAGNDVLSGGSGDDSIRGMDGNDVVFGNAGGDRLDGGTGEDRIYGGNGIDLFNNTGDGADTIFGGPGNDNLYGNLGDDKLWGAAGFDQLYGGDGNDLLAGGDQDDLIEGGLGGDTIYGDADLTISSTPVLDTASLSLHTGNDSLFGDARAPAGETDGDDKLYGGKGNDLIDANAGNDELHGDDGDDRLLGRSGDDKLYGENQNDTLGGGIGNDQMFGADGNDLMFGDDRFAAGPETVLTSGQTDDDYMEGGKGDDTMYGGAGADRMIGGTSSTAAADQDGTGKDFIAGDSGNDTLLGDNARFGSIILIGGAGDDTLLGGTGDDLIYGQGGNDTAEGGSGNDTIYGNAGNDALRGQDNNDYIEGGSGSDIILGGSGDDNLIGGVAVIADLAGIDDVADLIVGDLGNDVILGDNGTISGAARNVVTDPTGGAGNDSLYGGSGDDVIFGEGGGDLIVGDVAGGSGLDILVGDQGTRTATLITAQHSDASGSGGADSMFGSGGADILLGGDAADTIAGDAGNDIIVGDDGKVTLAGGIVVKIETVASPLGGADVIDGAADADVALGGDFGDSIDGGLGGDVLLGDNGLVDFLANGDSDATTLDLIHSNADNTGAADTISGGGGGDVAIGGTGGDTIFGDNATASNGAADGADILIGDNADITLAGHTGQLLVQVAGRAQGSAVVQIKTTDTTQDTGGIDTISGNANGDVVLGGVAGDTLYGDSAAPPAVSADGNDLVLGDNGEVDFNGPAGTLSLIRSYLDKAGDIDTISGNAGGDVVLGGTAGDVIYGDDVKASAGAGDGADILLGDNGDITLVDPKLYGGINGDAIGILGGGIATIKTTDIDTSTGGSDTIVGNAGGDIIAGGVLAEVIYGDAATLGTFDGNDVILGDNGRLEWLYAGDPTFGAADTSLATLDLITTEVPTLHPGGRDVIYGDAGNDIGFGGEYADTLYGDFGNLADSGGGSDILFGDHGLIYPRHSALPNFPSRNFFSIDTGNGVAAEGDRIWGESGDDVLLGEQGDDRLFGGSGNDDIIGGSNVAGAVDELATTDISARLDGATGPTVNDLIDGGSGDDAIAGDNATIWRKASFASARFQALSGTAIYSSTDSTETVNVTGTPQNDPNPVVGRDITLLDHSDSTPAGLYGADVIAGGAGNDLVFGELGDDLIQGDGLLDIAPAANIVSRTIMVADVGQSLPNTTQTLYFNVPEAPSDGDDYIEGNGGSDLIYGGLGQDDIIGGSSGLFGLTISAQRPDAGDTIYGGAATPAQLARNSAGTSGVDSHARDADVIVGDNGNIYRIVGINGSDSGKYLTFNYDATFGTSDVRGTLRIVPRAIQLLDYTLGGPDYNPTQAATDRGGADLIHGEGGDDIAYGMKGDDVLYGEGQNDDLIGGYGNDWISGGTGDDGVIGDDGRLMTSRNGFTEPLNGITVPTVQQTISTPGNIQLATINVTGTLTKAVNLTPLSNDPLWTPAVDEFGGITHRNADDIIFGGLGNDFLHGGSGDDAISGAEALVLSYAPTYDPVTGLANGLVEIDYSHPVNPGFVLAFNPSDVDAKHSNRTRAGEFALYNEYDPLRRILLNADGTASTWAANATPVGKEFFLNFDASEGPAAALDGTKKSDGDDKLFGDLGNDWLVGGTGRDDAYGGFGNDLINADDDPSTHNGLNDQPETSASYEDRAFGGAGRDVLIANTGGDRLIDWTGEFNTYLVPFAPFGMATVSRTLQPHLMDFLYALSAADGADPTRAADKASAGADPARNGEPWGELGLVLQKDAAWNDQHGGPADPQAGNIPGGQRDVLRSASFDNGNPQGFVPASGSWNVVNGRYQVAPATTGSTDAVSVFNTSDTVIPNYFEAQATINAVKPVGGVKANAYLIFDYQSPTDFKYAGINVSNNSLEIGHRTAAGWVLDKWTNLQLKAGNDYVLMLTVNGSMATVTVGTTSVNYTYPVRVDTLGITHTLNYGMLGIGANNASAQIDNVVVQSPPGATTLDATSDFSSASPPNKLFNTNLAPTGTWLNTTTDGRFVGTSSALNSPAINLIGYPVTAGSTLTILTTLKTFGQGGVVFDYQGPTYFKYAVLSADGKQIVIGHVLGNANVVDATYNTSISSGTDYKLGVTLRGGLVNVSLNGTVVVSKLYNETVTQGGYGLISFKGNTSGQTSFDIVQVKTDDATYPTAILQVAAASAPAGFAAALTDGELASIVVEAKALWTAALGASDTRLAVLDSINVQIGNLPQGVLGETTGDTIIIDSSAAGWGWFVDPTARDNSEFQVRVSSVAFAASPSSPASGRIDLLTTVLHEMGNAMGFAEDLSRDVTGMVLQAGERRLPASEPQLPGDVQGGRQPAALVSGNTAGLPPTFAAVPLAAASSEGATVAKLATSTILTSTEPVSSILAGAAAAARSTTPLGLPPVYAGAPLAAASPETVTVAKLATSTALAGDVPVSIIARSAAAGSGGLRGSFVNVAASLTADFTGAAASRSAPPAAVPQTDSPATERRSSRLSNSASGAPTINWDNHIDALDNLASGPSTGSQDWLDDFLNHVGQTETQRNPNVGIRVRPTPPTAHTA